MQFLFQAWFSLSCLIKVPHSSASLMNKQLTLC